MPKDREGDDIDPDYEPTATAMRDIAHENDEEQHEDEEDRSTHNEEQDDITRTHGTRRGTRTRRKPTEFWHTAYIATKMTVRCRQLRETIERQCGAQRCHSGRRPYNGN